MKPRLLGHWGTTPGLNFLYAHLNRMIKEREQSTIYITGPGHGGPGLVANAYLDGTYSEVYSDITADAEGMRRLFRQFSFPGGIPSHVAPETPGSIHEGGELGYALSHAYGAAFDNPDLLVAAVVGDGEAETGALATSWHSNKFTNPAKDGVVLPILHLNGYKIANPTVLARIPDDELTQPHGRLRPQAALLRGGRRPDDEARRHRTAGSPTLLDTVLDEIADIKARAAAGDETRPALADDRLPDPEGLDRARPTSTARRPPDRGAHTRFRSPTPATPPSTSRCWRTGWRSYRAEELFDENGSSIRDDRRTRPVGRAADERQPARQRRAAAEGSAAARLPQVRESTCLPPAPRSPRRPGCSVSG